MSWRQIVTMSELLNLRRSQVAQQLRCKIAKQRIPEPIDAFEMFKQQDKPFQMRGREFAVDAVEWVGDGVRDSMLGQIPLQLEDVTATDLDILVLRSRDAPNQQMNLTRILREVCSNLFANKRLRLI